MIHLRGKLKLQRLDSIEVTTVIQRRRLAERSVSLGQGATVEKQPNVAGKRPFLL